MYIETSSNNHGSENIFVSWERTDIIQITNITFYYNRFSILTHDPLKSMSRFRIQFLLENNTWSTQYTIPKNDQYSDNSTDWTLLNLDVTVENYGTKIIYDQIDTALADMCFSNITITFLYIKKENSIYFGDTFESKLDYRKILLIIFLIKNDPDLLLEIGFSERDITRLKLEFRKTLIEEHENYLDFIKMKKSLLSRSF